MRRSRLAHTGHERALRRLSGGAGGELVEGPRSLFHDEAELVPVDNLGAAGAGVSGEAGYLFDGDAGIQHEADEGVLQLAWRPPGPLSPCSIVAARNSRQMVAPRGELD